MNNSIKTISKTPLFGAIVITSVAYFIQYYFIGLPIWQTNDDVGMSFITAGVWSAPEPSSELFYVNILVGKLLALASQFNSTFPWYGFFMIGIQGLSILSVLYAILKVRNSILSWAIVFLPTLITLNVTSVHLQFTTVSMLAGVAGIIHFLSAIRNVQSSKWHRFTHYLVGIASILTSGLIRFDSLKIVLVISLPLMALELLRRFASKKDPIRFKKLIEILVSLSFAIALSYGCKLYNDHYFKTSKQWSSHMALNAYKSQLIDYSYVSYNEDVKNTFDSLNWSKNDYTMIIRWMYIDPVHFSVDKFKTFENTINPSIAWDNMIDAISNNYEYEKNRIVELSNKYLDKVTALVSMFIAIGLIALLINLNAWLPITYLTICNIFMLFYLISGLDRFPFRVAMGMWLASLWLGVFLLFRKDLAIRFKFLKIVFVLGILMWVFTDLQTDYKNAIARSNDADYYQGKLTKRINRWAEHLPEEAIVLVVGNAIDYESHRPLTSLSYFKQIKNVVTTGWNNQGAFQKEIIKGLGLEPEFFQSYLQSNRAYFKIKEETVDPFFDVRPLATYYQEHYQTQLIVDSVPGLHDIVKLSYRPMPLDSTDTIIPGLPYWILPDEND